MKEKKPLPKPFYSRSPWDENSNPLWPASAFFLYRNFSGNLFPQKMTSHQLIKMEDQLSQIVQKLSQLKNPISLKADEIIPIEKEFLNEHFVRREPFINTAKGQSFIVDDSTHFLATINFNDHLQIEIIDCNGRWEKAWSELNEIDTEISKILSPSYTDRFGYLTSDPSKCGTGFSVTCFLHFPLLIYFHQLQETCKKHLEESVKFLSLQGKQDDFTGDFVLLENKYTLGMTEEMILRDLHISANKLILAEKALRDKVKETQNIEIKDIISRALGLLKHSFQLQTVEVLDAISKIKLGIDLGWIEGVTDSQINEVFFTCQRAHIGFVFPSTSTDPKEILSKRAEFIHEKLKNVSFKQ